MRLYAYQYRISTNAIEFYKLLRLDKFWLVLSQGGNKALADPMAKKSPDGKKSSPGAAMHTVPEIMVMHPLNWNFWQSLSVIVAVSWTFESLLKVGELGELLCSSGADKENEALSTEDSIPR